MRIGGVPFAALLLVLATPILQVSSAGDLYWEGEEDAFNEFLEVKDDEPSIMDHLKRLKRQSWLSPWNLFSSTEKEAESVTDNIGAEDSGSYGKDDDQENFGSGLPDKTESEPREKTLRVTFLVMEPYIPAYSNRDSPEFLSISRSLANAVDLLFESLPGTQRSSLVRIQSLVNDDFLCKVTLDIVTTGYEDTDNIKDILRNHIKNNGRLGNTSVRDGDFSAQLIDPGTTLDCDDSEFKCDEDVCLPMSAKCDGRNDCSDGTDENDCPYPSYETSERSSYDYDSSATESIDQTSDNQDADNQNPYEAPTDSQDSYGRSPEQDQTSDNRSPDNTNTYEQNSVDQNSYDRTGDIDSRVSEDTNRGYPVDSTSEAPSSWDQDQDTGAWPSIRGDIGETNELNPTDIPESATTPEPPASPAEGTTRRNPTFPSEYDCPSNHLRCDETRCVEMDRRCDGYSDCDDGTDEAGCPDLIEN